MNRYKIILTQNHSLDRRYKRMVEIIMKTTKLDYIDSRKESWNEVVNGLDTYEINLNLTEEEVRALKNNFFEVQELI